MFISQNDISENAILDCIYHEVEKTFYVLDLMNWKDNPVYDSDVSTTAYYVGLFYIDDTFFQLDLSFLLILELYLKWLE